MNTKSSINAVSRKGRVLGGLWGAVVGDALGCPSLWCLLTTNSYSECVLKAVNLGGDTDTTGCVAGGLAGVAYGYETIPNEWMRQLARHPDLDQLFTAFSRLCENAT